MPKVGFYMPQRLQLSSTNPGNLRNVPAGAALFGSWSFGGKSYPTVEVQTAGAPTSIVVDFSATGDFAQAKTAAWNVRSMGPDASKGPHLYMVDLSAPSPIGGANPVQVTFYRFDPTDPQRAALKDTLLYYGNYALDGTITLKGKPYHAMLVDTASKGDFDPSTTPTAGPMGSAAILIDRDGDGKFRSPAETYDAFKPFNIDGTTYELTGLHGDGSSVHVGVSPKTVAEIKMPPNLAQGRKVVPFTAVDRSGKTVHFPQDFKGKIVMLDFWATWCGPCMGEVPNVVKVYNAKHSEGFEILGISLDNKDTVNNIASVTKEKGMTWDQIADGKYWDAAVAKLYGIQSIPAAYIVDGTTGTILASGDAIRGDSLLPAVQKALAASKQTPK